MAFLVFKTPIQGAYLVLLILCGVYSIIAICLRFLATQRSSRRRGAEDYLALVAVLTFLARTGFTLNCEQNIVMPLIGLHVTRKLFLFATF